MFIGTLLVALVLGLAFAALYGTVFGAREGAPGYLVVFVLLFLFAWAGSLWLAPFGPAILGVYWLPGLVVTLLIFLLLAALAEHRPPRTQREARAEIEARQETETALGIFFWVLIGGLVAAIVIALVV